MDVTEDPCCFDFAPSSLSDEPIPPFEWNPSNDENNANNVKLVGGRVCVQIIFVCVRHASKGSA